MLQWYGYCNTSQGVAVYCSVLQCVAMCCSAFQCIAVCCSGMGTVPLDKVHSTGLSLLARQAPDRE